MIRIRKTVPDRHAGEFCQIFHHLLIKAPVFDAVKEAAQYLGGIFHALLLAHLAAAGIQVGDVSPLLSGGHLEGTAGAGGGLFKEQDDVLAFQSGLADSGPALALQIVAQIQQVTDFLRSEVHEGKEGSAFEIDCH